MNNFVVLKGKKDRLEIYLNSEIDFLTLQESLKKKIKDANKFLGKSKMAIEFTNRDITSIEENELIELIKDNSQLNIHYVFSSANTTNDVKSIKFLKKISEEGITKFHKGTLRSGNQIQYEGSVVVIGDVNPGAVIKASGNVIVMGHLNGTVSAGGDYNKDSFICAMSLNPIKMSIANIALKIENKGSFEVNKVIKQKLFKVAFIKNDEVVIEEWV